MILLSLLIVAGFCPTSLYRLQQTNLKMIFFPLRYIVIVIMIPAMPSNILYIKLYSSGISLTDGIGSGAVAIVVVVEELLTLDSK